MTSWFGFAFLVLIACALMVVPGVLLSATLGLRGAKAWAYSPALGLGGFGLWTLIWGGIGLPWGMPAWVVLVAILAVAYAISLMLRRRDATKDLRNTRGTVVAAGLGIFTYAVIQLIVIIPVIGSPDAVPHLGDSPFHLQGTVVVWRLGNVFPLGGLSDLYTPGETSSIFYPTVWHGWTALMMPIAGVAEVTNAAITATGILLWPTSVVCLAAALRPGSRSALYLAPVMLAPIAMYPGALAVAYSIYPFALSLATVPAAIAAVLIWQRSGVTTYLVIAVVAIIGNATAQPAGALFSLLALLVSVGLVLVRWVVASWRSERRAPAAVLAVIGVLFAIVVFRARHSAYLKGLANYMRPPVYENPTLSFLDGTVAAVSSAWGPWIVFVVFASGGIVILARRWYGWTYIVTLIVFVIAYIASAGEDSLLRAMTGPWYKDHVRLASFAAALTVVSASVAVSWIWDRYIGKWFGTLGSLMAAGGLSATLLLIWGIWLPGISQVERAHISNAYRLDNEFTTPLTKDTAAVLSRLDEHFPEGGRILGAYGAGASFAVVYSNLQPMMPIGEPQSADQLLLARELSKINENVAVCEVIRAHTVVGFMVNSALPGKEAWMDVGRPPEIDVSEGFELVDQEGSVMVWRITACD